MDSSNPLVSLREPPRFVLQAWLDACARRFPFAGLLLAILASNFAGSAFSFFYNTQLIVDRMLDKPQKDAFWDGAAPLYNLLAYPLCIAAIFYVIRPLRDCLGLLRNGDPIDPAFLQFCRCRLVNFPIVQLSINSIGFLPGIFFFPWIITTCGGTHRADEIWIQFAVSFVISMVFTTVQTFFILQSYLTAYLYPDFFRNARPEDIPGVIKIPFTVRLVMLWLAVAVTPLVALLAVALNMYSEDTDHKGLDLFAIGLVVVSVLSGGAIFWLVGRDLWRWIQVQTLATGQIAKGNFDIHIDQPRPDEWGQLTNHFNDMAAALAISWESHETLGQLVSPEVRDQILRSMHGFEVQLQEITVLFVDIRGFTPRCAGESPERIGALLNQFLTLVVRAIEEKGGYVNKFLGDGVMALFGATHHQEDHADLALASAQEVLDRLKELNEDLIAHGQAPLVLGIGIHTGIALVGCFGASLQDDKGKPIMRREFTAIGETVNLCQRIEQLTKKCGGPILISEGTRLRLHVTWPLHSVGPQVLTGSPEPMIVHRVDMPVHGPSG